MPSSSPRQGGNVAVELRADGASRDCILRVRDTGIGIAAKDVPHVFDRFFRSDKSRHRNGRSHGTGLGLSICQSVVAAHQGPIEIVSTPAAGTEVIVRLPLLTSLVESPAASQYSAR